MRSSAVMLGLKIKIFSNNSIEFHYCFEYFNGYLPFECLIVV